MPFGSYFNVHTVGVVDNICWYDNKTNHANANCYDAMVFLILAC